MVVTVNWDREKVEVEICFVYGTFITKTFISQYYYTESLLFVIYMSVALHIVEMVAWQAVAFLNTKQQETHADVMIYVSPQQEQICFILETMNFTAVSD